MNNRKIKIISLNTQPQQPQGTYQSYQNPFDQTQNRPIFQYQNQNTNNLENQNQKIKFKQDIQINPQRSTYFSNLLTQVQADINSNEIQYHIFPYIENDQTINQFWRFEFLGQGNFNGRTISGILKFQPDHPISAPRFIFDPINTDQGVEVLQHENIYGDHSLCLPLITYWKNSTTELEILQAIEHIFHNPNWSAGSDAPANPLYASETCENQQRIQKRQAQFLPLFEKNM